MVRPSVWCSKGSILEKLRKANSHTPDSLKHQNTKTSLYKLSEYHRVLALFEFLGPSEKDYNLQSTDGKINQPVLH